MATQFAAFSSRHFEGGQFLPMNRSCCTIKMHDYCQGKLLAVTMAEQLSRDENGCGTEVERAMEIADVIEPYMFMQTFWALSYPLTTKTLHKQQLRFRISLLF